MARRSARPEAERFISNRTEYAKAARSGLTALETEPRGLRRPIR